MTTMVIMMIASYKKISVICFKQGFSAAFNRLFNMKIFMQRHSNFIINDQLGTHFLKYNFNVFSHFLHKLCQYMYFPSHTHEARLILEMESNESKMSISIKRVKKMTTSKKRFF